LNAAFREAKTNFRCWPLQVGNWKLFRKIIEAVKLQGVAIEDDFLENVHEAAFLDESARAPVQAADWMYPSETGWQASNVFGEAAVQSILEVYRKKEPENPEPLKGKTVVLAGSDAKARMMISRLRDHGAALIYASRDKATVQRLAQTFGGRFILWDAIYQTFHDVLILGREGPAKTEEEEEAEMPLHPGYLRQGMVVLDLHAGLTENKFLREAKLRGCLPISARSIIVHRSRTIANRTAGTQISDQLLADKLAEWKPIEE
jgi:shikimate 5-dehydrogenase